MNAQPNQETTLNGITRWRFTLVLVVFGCLLIFAALFFRTMSREEGL